MTYTIGFSLGVMLVAMSLPVTDVWNLATSFVGGFLVAIALKKWIVEHTDDSTYHHYHYGIDE